MTIETLKVVISAETDKLNKGLSDTKKKLSDTSKSIKKTSKGGESEFKKLGKQFALAHIAVNLIMKAVAGLAKLFKQGLSNAYEFSKATGGDLAKNLDGLKSSLSYLANTLGAILVPILNKILPIINELITKVADFANGLTETISAVTGSKEFLKATKQAEAWGDAVEDSAEKAKKATMGFDELNIVDSGEGDSKKTENPAEIFSKEKVDTSNLLSIATVFDKINAGITKLTTKINGFFKKTDWKKFGKTIGEVFNGLISSIKTLVTGIDWNNLGKSLMTAVMNLIKTIDWAEVVNTLFALINSALDLLSGLVQAIDWGALFDAVFTIIGSVLDNIINGDFLNKLFETVGVLIGKILEGIVTFWKKGIDIFKQIITAIKDYFKGKIDEAGGNVAQGLLNGIWEGIKNIGKWVYDKIIGPLLDGLAKGLGLGEDRTAFVKKFEEVWDSVSKWATGIWKDIEAFFKKLGDWISYGFAVAVNGGVDVLNTIIKTITAGHLRDFLANTFGWDWIKGDLTIGYMTVPPKPMAQGGIVDRATNAIIGENGREAVVPLENNTEWIDMLAEKLSANTPSRISLNVDGKQLGYAVINNINNITKQTGSLQLSLG